MAVSLYSNEPDVHDTITRVPGSHSKTMQSLLWLKDAEVPVRIAIVLMRQNQQTIDETIKWIEEMGFRNKGADIVRSTGRGCDLELQPDAEALVRFGLSTAPNFKADRRQFTQNRSSNSCLAGKITITDVGTVLPCVFWRDKVTGNVSTNSLTEIVYGDSLQRVWRTTKDTVAVCRDCEYRYACPDCRPLAHAVTGSLVGEAEPPYPRCTYNPYTGQWANGVWRANEKGEIYYDTSIEILLKNLPTKIHNRKG